MPGRPIVRVGDTTTHGGTVLEGFSFYNVLGRAAAGMGHMVSCPRCAGVFPIAEGVTTFAIADSFVAVDGMKTACGAALIASQTSAVVSVGPGGIARASIDGRAFTKSSLTDQALPEQRLSKEGKRADCDHPDTAIALAEYIVREMKTNPFSIRGRQIHDANHYDIRAYYQELESAPWYLRLSARKTYIERKAEQQLSAYMLFADIIGPSRPWDHKSTLRRMLGPRLNKGWQRYGNFDYYYDIWSNIHYGYVGVALGFNTAELINSAGIAQALLDTYTALMESRWPTMQNHPENGPWPASADDVPDHISIKLGCNLYGQTKPHELTTATLLQVVEAVPLPWGNDEHHAKEIHNCDRKGT